MKPQIKNEINALRLAGLKPGEIAHPHPATSGDPQYHRLPAMRETHPADAGPAFEKVLF